MKKQQQQTFLIYFKVKVYRHECQTLHKKKVPLCLDSEKRKGNSRNKTVKILEVKKKENKMYIITSK